MGLRESNGLRATEIVYSLVFGQYGFGHEFRSTVHCGRTLVAKL